MCFRFKSIRRCFRFNFRVNVLIEDLRKVKSIDIGFVVPKDHHVKRSQPCMITFCEGVTKNITQTKLDKLKNLILYVGYRQKYPIKYFFS